MSAEMQSIPCATEHLLLMGEQANAVNPYSVGPALWGSGLKEPYILLNSNYSCSLVK